MTNYRIFIFVRLGEFRPPGCFEKGFYLTDECVIINTNMSWRVNDVYECVIIYNFYSFQMVSSKPLLFVAANILLDDEDHTT